MKLAPPLHIKPPALSTGASGIFRCISKALERRRARRLGSSDTRKRYWRTKSALALPLVLRHEITPGRRATSPAILRCLPFRPRLIDSWDLGAARGDLLDRLGYLEEYRSARSARRRRPIPRRFAAPLAGTMADRMDRRVLALRLQLFSVIPAVLALLAVLFGATSVPVLVGLSLLTGILNGFDHPVRIVLVGGLVERNMLTSSVTLNSIVFNLGRMAGPALGGVAIASGQIEAVLLFNAVSYLAFALLLARLRYKAHSTYLGQGSDPLGWLHVLPHLTVTHRVVLVYFAAVALCIRPVFELLPAFADGLALRPDLAAELFAWLTSAQALGAVLGGVAIGILSGHAAPLRSILSSGLAIMGSMALFLLSSRPWLSIVALTLVSSGIVANGVACQVVLQTQVSDRVRGKVLSVYTMMFRGLPALGALVVGVLAQSIPQANLFWTGIALIALATCIAWALLRRSIGGDKSA
ncbi:MFS transporter [Arsenicitalea aurantiaca]|nr:MFS transporter [Arsenicitalea aurantiaca]